MNSTSLLDEDIFAEGGSVKKPLKIFFYLSLFSVFLGTSIGIYGLMTSNTASNSKEIFIGVTGYLLTALIPIVFLQINRIRHISALVNNKTVPYDSYAGQQLESKFLKAVFAGLLFAGISIWVLFLPMAEKFA